MNRKQLELCANYSYTKAGKKHQCLIGTECKLALDKPKRCSYYEWCVKPISEDASQ